MALTTVTLHGELLDLDGLTPAVGTVTFKTLIELNDTVDNITYPPATFVATLDLNGEFTIVLPATDNPDITPLNWVYQVFISTTTWRETAYIQLPFQVPVIEFADVPRLDYDPCTAPDLSEPTPTELALFVLKAGDTMTGDLNINADLNVSGDASVDGTLGAGFFELQPTNPIPFGGDITESQTAVVNRPTLINPGTAPDTWQFQYNGVRVIYANEFACLRVRGIPDNQVPVRFMSHVTRDNTAHPILQVSLSDATTHWLQVFANGDIQAAGGLSMLPSTPVGVTFNGAAGTANAALISDGSASGAPYAVTTTLMAADNRVFLDGSIANPTGISIAGGTVLFTVTAAHRPTQWTQRIVRTSTALQARLTIKPNGEAVLDQALAAGATCSFDGVNWRKS